jgi:prefoldin subunit 5
VQKDVEIVTRERDQAVSRWDQRIEQRKAALIKLEAEIAALKKQIG